jgi:hypothetical protein
MTPATKENDVKEPSNIMAPPCNHEYMQKTRDLKKERNISEK